MVRKLSVFDKLVKKISHQYPLEIYNSYRFHCQRLSYEQMIKETSNVPLASNQFPTIHTGWDNTPRSGTRGRVFYDFTSELFGEHCRKVLSLIKNRNDGFCFIKSWNEWAEGNYLEPDERFGIEKLTEFKDAVAELNINGGG